MMRSVQLFTLALLLWKEAAVGLFARVQDGVYLDSGRDALPESVSSIDSETSVVYYLWDSREKVGPQHAAGPATHSWNGISPTASPLSASFPLQDESEQEPTGADYKILPVTHFTKRNNSKIVQLLYHGFGRETRLEVSLESDFISPFLSVQSGDRVWVERQRGQGEACGGSTGGCEDGDASADSEKRGCFLSGLVNGNEGTLVHGNLCSGLRAHLLHEDGYSYDIEPAPSWELDGSHKITRYLNHDGARKKRSVLAERHSSKGVGNRTVVEFVEVKDTDEKHTSMDYGADFPGDFLTFEDLEKLGFEGLGTPSLELPATEDPEACATNTEEHFAQKSKAPLPSASSTVKGLESAPLVLDLRSSRAPSTKPGVDALYDMTPEAESETESELLESEGESQRYESEATTKKVRGKRSVSRKRYIEVMVVTDQLMKRYHGDNLENYVLSLFKGAASVLKHPSLGNDINLVLTKLHMLDAHSAEGLEIVPDAYETLRNFCEWQLHRRGVANYDAAILLTRKDIARGKNTGTLGVAKIGVVCQPHLSCAVVEDRGLISAITVAHEIGHLLDAPHDNDRSCLPEVIARRGHGSSSGGGVSMVDRQRGYRGGGPPELRVMSAVIKYEWSWSSCSRIYITDFLDLPGNGECLLNKPRVQKEYTKKLAAFEGKFPGRHYSQDDQCEHWFGEGHTACDTILENSCEALFCRSPASSGESHVCASPNVPWADGTYCQPGKWCQRGACVEKRASPPPVHGEWGAWLPLSPCSRTCGGGVRRQQRLCNNPPPTNGGNYCLGSRVLYHPCGITPCPADSMEFRQKQCQDQINHQTNVNGQYGYRKFTNATYYKEKSVSCKLYCVDDHTRQSLLLAEKVIDGTKCHPGKTDMCVNGQCRPTGCDDVLSSKKVYDLCGICGGDSSLCVQNETSKLVRVKGGYTYSHVAEVPSGVSNVRVSLKKHPFLYLSAAESNGRYMFNGDKRIVSSAVVPLSGGLVLSYRSGIHDDIFTIKGGQLPQPVIVMALNFQDDPVDIMLNISYVSPLEKSRAFDWRPLGDWKCSSICQGSGHRLLVCVNINTLHTVADSLCLNKERPKKGIKQPCNTHCRLLWKAKDLGSCPSRCGRGWVRRRVTCMKESTLTSQKLAVTVNESYCRTSIRERKPRDIKECRGECLPPSWLYSDWSVCSRRCEQTRRIHCVTQGSQGETTYYSDRNCASIKREKEEVSKYCGTCARWSYTNWSQCSATCGQGLTQRRAICRFKGREVPSSYCDWLPSQAVEGPCQTRECGTWATEKWSQCSVTCGQGDKRRAVKCVVGTRKVTERLCTVKKKPAQKEKCHLEACPTPKWTVGPWLECSVTCGTGVSTRDVWCSVSQQKVPVEVCLRSSLPPPPPATTQCRKEECPEPSTTTAITTTTTTTTPTPTTTTTPLPITTTTTTPLPTTTTTLPPTTTPSTTTTPPPTTVTTSTTTVAMTTTAGVKMDTSSMSASAPVIDWSLVVTPTSTDVSFEQEESASWFTSEWTECSLACGSGVRSRTVSCVADSTGVPVHLSSCSTHNHPLSHEVCFGEKCGKWIMGHWGPCSASCGDGVKSRVVLCLYNNTYPGPHNSFCDPNLKAPTETECRNMPCDLEQTTSDLDPVTSTAAPLEKARWRKGPWSRCSKSCGGGVKRRVVQCSILLSPGDRSLCDLSAIPQSSAVCHSQACPVWRFGAWGLCSVTCGGGGIQLRQVACMTVKGRQLRRDACDTSVAPTRSQTCGQTPCFFLKSTTPPSTRSTSEIVSTTVLTPPAIATTTVTLITEPAAVAIWVYGDWSDCSVTCGSGQKRRKVTCAIGSVTMDVSECHHGDDDPVTMRPCQKEDCPPEWIFGDWSLCSVSCGMGFSTREVTCWNSMSNSSEEEVKCLGLSEEGSRPADRRECTGTVTSCPQWSSPSWEEVKCSVTCGEGLKTRPVVCLQSGVPAAQELCPLDRKPEEITSCMQPVCFEWSVSDWSECSKSCGEGSVQMRDVRCSPVLSSTSFPPVSTTESFHSASSAHLPAIGERIDDSTKRGDIIDILLDDDVIGRRDDINDLSSDVILQDDDVILQDDDVTGSSSDVTGSSSDVIGSSSGRAPLSRAVTESYSKDLELCDPSTRPQTSRPCGHIQRVCPYWSVTSWGRCGVSCGKGVRSRSVACIRPVEDVKGQMALLVANETLCKTDGKPAGVASCDAGECPRWKIKGDWSECPVRCGRARQSRVVRCAVGFMPVANAYCDPAEKPPTSRPCEGTRCPRWLAGKWAQCSSLCGLGIQTRSVSCSDYDGNMTSPLFCVSSGKRPEKMRLCQGTICSVWNTTPWSECSVSCGRGVKTRSLSCVDPLSNLPMPESTCDTGVTPNIVRPCETKTCPLYYITDWGNCSSQCGGGFQRRHVICYDYDSEGGSGRRVPLSRCRLPAPPAVRTCNMLNCPYWNVSTWSQCNVECGYGKRNRKVLCTDGAGLEERDNVCSKYSEKPASISLCHQGACSAGIKGQGHWVASGYSECSSSCGPGVEIRAVTCRSTTPEGALSENAVDEDHCDHTKRPSTRRTCNYGNCDSAYRWSVTSWRKCEVSCGFGRSRRQVFCSAAADGSRSRHSNCEATYKPERKRVCYEKPCYANSCRELRRRNKVKADGNYLLSARGHLVKVYCHNMQSKLPSEYLTLTSANYAEVHGEVLDDPTKCPQLGRRLGDCGRRCRSQPYSRAGRTRYTKVRLDLSRMALITGDQVFSATDVGGASVEYGSAGDCYSNTTNCSQGSFTVNLSGTGFTVDNSTEWVTTGRSLQKITQFTEDNLIVMGRCGGFCGLCRPRGGLILIQPISST